MNNIHILGFSLLKNGLKYDYPFMESISSLTELCEETFLAHGDSEDSTAEHLKKFSDLNVVNTTWDTALMGDGGQILSQQSNIALDALRARHGQRDNAWAFYLQTDEVIHERDIGQIKKDIQAAHEGGYDAVSFRYYHFWLDHNHVAISKRWYPQEVRSIKLKSDILSHGDAQGFSGITKIFESDVHIFHYGHVRDKTKREAKQELLMKMIRPGDKIKKYMNREKRAFKNTMTLAYYGSHPKWMKERIERFGDHFSLPKVGQVNIFDPEGLVNSDYIKNISAEKVEVSANERFKNSVSLYPSFWQKIGLSKKFPVKMMSPYARKWTFEQRFNFLLWSKDISTF